MLNRLFIESISMSIEFSTLEEQLQKFQEDLAGREAKIVKLKNLLKRSMRSEKRGEQQAESLQIDVDDRNRHIQMLNQELEDINSFSAQQSERIEQLELELTEMSNRLQSGAGSEAIQKRSERMKQMIEKSNQLYTDLQSRYRQVCEELDDEKRKKLQPAITEKVIILSDEEAVTFCKNGRYEIQKPIKHYPKGVLVKDFRNGALKTERKDPNFESDGQSLFKVYLRGILLEFLIADASTQIQLIPVILSLLDCSSEQITATQKGFIEGKQFIAKAALALGL
jgi:myosin heavy subunit